MVPARTADEPRRRHEGPEDPRSRPEDLRARLAVVILAAGAGSRFSTSPGAKLLADLDGRPLLAHVLDAVRSFAPIATVVVLGHGAPTVERSVLWRDEIRVVNHAPERGLASSLRSGMRALASLPGAVDGAFIVLGDQPRLRASVMHELAAAASESSETGRALIVPRYRDQPGPRNPVLLLRPAWGLVEGLEGDRGLATLIETAGDLVIEVGVEGTMPDVDHPADLARLRALGPKTEPVDSEPRK